jgi:TolB-like protein/Flp pilus assembly protein TadD
MSDEATPAPPPPAATVFLSHSRADRKVAQDILLILEDAGYRVWWDGLLGGGERFSQVIGAALESARAVVVLWSRTSIESRWVQDEASHGAREGRLVPLSVEGARPPLGFRQFHTIRLSGSTPSAGSPEVLQLLEAVAALHDVPVTPRSPSSHTPRGLRVGRRTLIAGGAGLAAVGAGAAAWMSGFFGRPAASGNSVAVLPFANIGGNSAQDYFADGLSAELRADLARNTALRVVGQTSSNVFKAHTEDAKAIARKLSVAYLLDGNVRLAGDQVRVAAEMIDGQTGFSRWSQTFDGALANIFKVQGDIADAVTAALTREVGKADDPAGSGGTSSVTAFDAYLRGRAAYALAAGAETDHDALAHFDEAVAADPKFGAAFAARSRVLAAIANQQPAGGPRRGLYDDAIASAKRAVVLAPRLADAYSALAFVLVSGRLDVRGARAPYDRSYALGPGDPDVLARYAQYCAQTGRFDEAETAIRRARELDPLNPRTFWITGFIEYAERRFAQAIAGMQQALSLNPRMANTNGYIGFALLMLGKTAEAEQAALKETSPLTRLPGIAIAAHRLGQGAEARDAFSKLVADLGDNGLYQQAQILAQWGDAKGALATLERARAAGDSGLFLAGRDPLLDPIRGRLQFSQLLAELGFA